MRIHGTELYLVIVLSCACTSSIPAREMAGQGQADEMPTLQMMIEQDLPYIETVDLALKRSADNSLKSRGGPRMKVRGGYGFGGIPAIGALRLDHGVHCTATAIGRQTVLTAAHCLHVCEKENQRLEFVVGPDARDPIQVYPIRGCAIAPGYDRNSKAVDDIGVAYLTKDFVNGPLVSYPKAGMISPLRATLLLFVGYGFADSNGGGLGKKRKVELRTREEKEKTFKYGGGGVGTCQGDSGGPALLRSVGDGVVGTTSWEVNGFFCGNEDIDMRVDAFSGWLETVVQ